MKISKLFLSIALVLLIAVSLPSCGASRTQPPAVPTAAPAGNEEYREVFAAVWSTVDETYFDPDFGGLDWDAIHDEYEPLIIAAADDEAFYRLLNQMLWELNVSHTGVGPGGMWTLIEPVVFAHGEIGIDVRLLDDRAVITRVEAASPAEAAGLHAGFVIQGIDGVSVEEILANEQGHLSPPYNEQGRIDGLTRSLLSLIYGDPDQCVTLAYLDQDDARHEQCIDRVPRPWLAPMAGAALPPAFLEFESGRLENGIGYVRFNTFHPELVPDMVEAVAALRDAPGILIDLRGNPGGSLEAGEPLAGQFLEERALFGSFKLRDETIAVYVDGEGVYAGPVVILIDALSYSCSEWFAFGMQAAGRAVIVGERSPGAITAMDVKNLPNGASLAYPVATLLALDGTMLEGRGVVPDIAVPLDRAQLLAGIDAQWEAGIDYLLGTTQE